MEDPATWPHLCSHPHSVDGRTDYQPRRTGLTTASAMPSSSAHRLSAPGGFRLRPVMSQDTTKEKPPRWPAPPTCCRSAPGSFRFSPVTSQDAPEEQPPGCPAPPARRQSAPKQLLVKPNDVANKPAGPDEVACNDVGAAGGRPRALGPHPGAQVSLSRLARACPPPREPSCTPCGRSAGSSPSRPPRVRSAGPGTSRQHPAAP